MQLNILGFVGLMLLSPTRGHPAKSDINPRHESARENAHIVFNTIHSAGRQWGSALYHNGFSFFPAIVPAGTLFYHGGRTAEVPEDLEWLAFEIEHAAAFASSKMPGPGQPHKGKSGLSSDQKPLVAAKNMKSAQNEDKDKNEGADNPTRNVRGYLHTYQASRDLKLLYLDGMSAGKTDFGTLDSQDLVLREGQPIGFFDEYERAADICEILRQWNWDGFVRSEAGFEVVYCDFTSGVKQTSTKRSFFHQDKMGRDDFFAYHWIREVGKRYDGLGGRLDIDYSSIVSGLFYPINISSTCRSRPELKRLGAAKMQDLMAIKAHVSDMAARPRRFNVDWQQVVDMIVTRYSEGIAIMASESLDDSFFLTELDRVTLIYIDAPSLEDDMNAVPVDEENDTNAPLNKTDSIMDCRNHYLLPPRQSKTNWSLEDDLIYTALDTVMKDICTTMFSIRHQLLKVAPDPEAYGLLRHLDDSHGRMSHAIRQERHTMTDLKTRLGWTTWLETRQCPLGETISVAMWPYGSDDDHYRPGCRAAVNITWEQQNYWREPVE